MLGGPRKQDKMAIAFELGFHEDCISWTGNEEIRWKRETEIHEEKDDMLLNQSLSSLGLLSANLCKLHLKWTHIVEHDGQSTRSKWYCSMSVSLNLMLFSVQFSLVA